MRTHTELLEAIANDLLYQTADNQGKPNYSNRDFMNTIIIFQTALMDKMFDVQDFDNFDIEDRMDMAQRCGEELRKFVHTYTGLDTHKFEEFL